MLGIFSFGAPFLAGICILLSDSFVFLSLLFIPVILIGGIISGLIALIRRERCSALPVCGLVAGISLFAWVAHRILTSEWHF